RKAADRIMDRGLGGSALIAVVPVLLIPMGLVPVLGVPAAGPAAAVGVDSARVHRESAGVREAGAARRPRLPDVPVAAGVAARDVRAGRGTRGRGRGRVATGLAVSGRPGGILAGLAIVVGL